MADDESSLKELDPWKEGPADTIDGLNEVLKVQNALVRVVKQMLKNKPKRFKAIVRNNDNSEWRRATLLGVDHEGFTGEVCECDCDCGSGSGGEDVGSS